MRRNARSRRNDSILKNLMFWSGAVLLIAVITFGVTYAIYNSKVKSESRISQLNYREIGELVPSLNIDEKDEKTKSASVQIGKTIDEVEDDLNKDNNEMQEITNESIPETNIIEQTEIENDMDDSIYENEEKIEEVVKKELKFTMPVDGEIYKEFAKDNLVYSETLKEWTTHLGVDIKADKASVVKAAEAGKVKAIKNDPRYGITVTIEHQDGFKTVYANLLTAEFVSEGEDVIQGQTVGTVGTSANFETVEEPHLHFEIWKDGDALNPELYFK